MEKIVEFIRKMIHSPEFHMSYAFAGIGGMIASSFLFVKGVKETKNGIKQHYLKGVGMGLLKCLPMILSACLTIAGILTMRHVYTTEISTAADAISRLSSLAAPAAAIVKEPVDDIIDKMTDNVSETVSKKDDPKPQSHDNDLIDMVDSLSGQRFQSTVNRVEKAVNDFNSKLLGGDFYSVNDWYYYLGLSDTAMGDKLGWQIDPNGDGMLSVRFNPRIEDGKVATYICYRVNPQSENTRWC